MKPWESTFLPPIVFVAWLGWHPHAAATALTKSTHLVCVYIRKGGTYLGVLNEPVGRELAGREQGLAEGGCGMRCGAVAC